MGMNEVSGFAPQPRPQVGNAGTPLAVAGGLGLGGIGATAGYFIGNKRPNLEKVFTQTPDSFTSEAVTKKDADAAKTLQDAVTEYSEAGTKEKQALRRASYNIAAHTNGLDIENKAELQKKIEDARTAYNNKIVVIDGKEMNAKDIATDLKQAAVEMNAAKNLDDSAKAAAVEKMKKARVNAQVFNEATRAEAKAVVEAQKSLSAALATEFIKKSEVDGSVEKALKEVFKKANTDFENVKANKLKELLDKKEVTEAFEKIKKAIPKEGGTRMALIAGSIAATVGILGGLILGGSAKPQT